jgi:hypothetical protein
MIGDPDIGDIGQILDLGAPQLFVAEQSRNQYQRGLFHRRYLEMGFPDKGLQRIAGGSRARRCLTGVGSMAKGSNRERNASINRYRARRGRRTLHLFGYPRFV